MLLIIHDIVYENNRPYQIIVKILESIFFKNIEIGLIGVDRTHSAGIDFSDI
jgi:hypothetical protein